uniref:Ig-like domain-containing protein n=1 Tax=Neogobius melanostomus TaxID=47308 RepID=A0A8C6STI7_9GOBI
TFIFLSDVNVSCVFRESCVLPCPFTPGTDPVIHWTKETGDIPVHNYFRNQHQLHLQHENYRDRTTLSDQGIRTGDASLQLHKVNVSDEGKYECYVSTVKPDNVKEFYVNLKVYAPVLEVSLQQEEERLLCRSENIYPRPDVNWTPSPEPLEKPLTDITSSETGLFSVLSSVPLPQRPLEEYSCNISTAYSWRSATYRRNPEIRLSDSLTVPCVEVTAPVKSLVWKFNHKKTIYNKTGTNQTFSDFWSDFVDGLTKSNGLALKDLTLDQLDCSPVRSPLTLRHSL